MAKHLKQLEHSGAKAMAGLLLCVVGCIPLSGCLLPQDEQVIPELPPLKNNPPRIVSAKPAGLLATYATSPTCATKNPEFALTVEEKDTSDTLRSHWFIDFGDSTSGTIPTPYPASTVRPEGGKEVREVKAPGSPSFTTALSNLPAGTHLLTAYVADREFDAFSGTVILVKGDVPLPDGGTAPDDGYLDTTTWVLTVGSCP